MIRQISLIEKYRTQLRKQIAPKFGIGKIVGYFIFLSFFTIIPEALRIIWPWMLTNFTQTQIYVGSIFIMNIGIFVSYNGTMHIIYKIKHPFFQQYKNTSKAWPWQQNPKTWQQLKIKSFKFIAINFFVVTPTMVSISLLTSLPYQFSIESWPTKLQFISQFFLFLIIQDIAFYYAHRLLHQPNWYWIHKYHHEYHQTIGITAHYVHPLEYVIAGTIPSTIGFQLLSFIYPVHYITIIVFLMYRIIQSYQGHCGYQWSWNTLSLFPYTVGSDHHDFHHAMNSGNYGSVFLFLDAYHKTEVPFANYLCQKVDKKTHKKQCND